MNPPTASIIRMFCDITRTSGLTNILTSTSPVSWRSSALEFQIGLAFNNQIFTDISTIASITLEIKPLSATGGAPTPETEPLMSKTIPSDQLNQITQQGWSNGTQQHAAIRFTATEANISPGKKWLVVSVDTFEAGGPFTATAGFIEVPEDGYNSAGLAPTPDTSAYSREQSDARYGDSLQVMYRLSGGSVALYNSTDQLWYRMGVTSAPGGTTLYVSEQGYSSPSLIPGGENPLEQPITFVSGTSFLVGNSFTVAATQDIAWLTAASLMEFVDSATADIKGRAQVLSMAGSNITLQVVEADFTAAPVTGDIMRLQALAGQTGAKGDDGDTVAEDRLEVLEAGNRGRGGVFSPGLDGGTGGGGFVYDAPPALDKDRTFMLRVEGGDYLSGEYYFRGVFIGGDNFAIFSRNGLSTNEIGIFVSSEGRPTIQIAPVYIYNGEKWKLAIRWYSATNQVQAVVNGVEYPAVTVPWTVTGTVQRVLSSHPAGSGEFAGWCDNHKVYNRILSLDEINDCFNYGVAAEDRWGANIANAWVNGRFGYSPWSSFSQNGDSLELVNTVADYPACHCNTPFLLKRVVVEVSADVSNLSGDVKCGFFDNTTFDATVDVLEGSLALTEGNWKLKAFVKTRASMLTISSGSQTASVTMQNTKMAVLGAEVDCGPDGASPSGYWMSSTGRGLSLGQSSEFTSLSSKVQQQVLPCTWPTTSVPANGGANVLSTSAQNPLIAFVKTVDALVWSPTSGVSLPAGLVIKDGPVCTSQGNISIPVRNVTAADILTGAHTGSIVRTIN
ncbi:MAG: hypothetical protein LBV12_07040 [Puniceicoccales bacterium]|jgi:hypothetical protein|nr:hypothetical protein [Puniceicoccales bacterium]